MQKSIAVLLIVMAAMSCRHHKEEVASTSTETTATASTQSDVPLTGTTRKAEEPAEAPKHLGPEVGTDLPAPGALINVPALAGRSRERIEQVIGAPEDKQKSIYRVSGQPIHIIYERDRAMWFEVAVPWPVLNAVDALRLLGLETVNLIPDKETDSEVDYTVEFSGVEVEGEKEKITKLRGVATKPQTAPEWTDVGAGIRRPLNY